MMTTKLNQNLISILPDKEILSQCIHCGMCLSACPTYEITKLERSSPRGRIRLIKSAAEGEIPVTGIFADEMNFCLDCQACETACPAGVKYGLMVEAARVEAEKSGSLIHRSLKKFLLKYILISDKRLKLFAVILRSYQRSLFRKFLISYGILKKISPILAEIEELSPEVSAEFSDKIIKQATMPLKGSRRYRIAFLKGCLMNIMFAEINRDTVVLLSALGCEVYTPENQVCCGSLNAHNGDFETAKKLARENIKIFGKNFDYLVSNSAGCGAFMKQYGEFLKDDPEFSRQAEEFSSKVMDIMEFLTGTDIKLNFGPSDERITYHDACHLAHSQKVTAQPRKLLKSIPGITFIPLTESDWCCGSAGIYNITRYNDSMTFLERKMKHIKNTGAQIVLTGNPGCISQIEYGSKKFGTDVKVMHPVSFILKKMIKTE